MNGNTLRTGKCLHCGKTKEEHHFYDGANMNLALFYCSRTGANQFYDSGLAALDAHKEELYAFVLEVSRAHPDGNPILLIKKAQSILNQIEKEK